MWVSIFYEFVCRWRSDGVPGTTGGASGSSRLQAAGLAGTRVVRVTASGMGYTPVCETDIGYTPVCETDIGYTPVCETDTLNTTIHVC